MTPLITILLATKDRPGDLRRTLRHLSDQHYPEIELLIIDDGSKPTLESVVREESPHATYIYKANSAGCPQRRSEGFGIAKGDYILQLDDDSYPVHPDALSRAVQMMQTRPEIGILGFYIFNGEHVPKQLPTLSPKYDSSFVGCGALIRATAVRESGGYQDFFQGEREEEELGLRLMKSHWAIYFFPSVLIHHLVSPSNRSFARAWKRAFRNRLWVMVMHFPASRLPIEITWVLAVAAFDAVRLLRFRAFAQGMLEFFGGLPRAARLRDPMSNLVLRRYDAMRFGALRTEEEYKNPPKVRVRDLIFWFRTWLNRPRQRSFWDWRDGDIGTSATVKYAHEYTAEGSRSQDC
jgi:GT2 family glycosyltransferase